MSTYVHTLGDSTLDNLYWMVNEDGTNVSEAKKKSVEGQLQKLLDAKATQGRTYKVISHAYDGFTTTSLLRGDGDEIGQVLPEWGQKKSSYLKEKGSGSVKPLKKLKDRVAAAPDATHYVVLSVGGNDFRENLSQPWRLLFDIPKVQARYAQITKEIKLLPGKDIRPILMFQYRTDAKNDPYKIYTLLGVLGTAATAVHTACLTVCSVATFSFFAFGYSLSKAITALFTGALFYASRRVIPFEVTANILWGHNRTLTLQNAAMTLLGALMEKFYQPMLAQAKTDRIPILDLPNTFNPYKPLYTSGIEPNKNGAALIAEGLAHIITEHDFTSPSALYAKTDERYTATPNDDPASWHVRTIAEA